MTSLKVSPLIDKKKMIAVLHLAALTPMALHTTHTVQQIRRKPVNRNTETKKEYKRNEVNGRNDRRKLTGNNGK